MIDRQLSTSSQSASLLGAFAVLALVLASLGIYGVLSYAVTQRTNEIGVRMALGATAGEILRSFTRQGLGLTMFGLVIGLAAGEAASRVLTTLLYGYRPDYFSTDMRFSRRIYVRNGLNLDFSAESFNLLNRVNRRFTLTDDGAMSNAAQFNYGTKHLGIRYFPAYYQVPTNFMKATNAYAPRQVQLALRLGF